MMKHHNTPCSPAHRPPRKRRGPGIGVAAAAGAAGTLAVLAAVCAPPSATARDTDVYNESHGQNAYILMDSSGSMGGTVYEGSIDYGRLYDWYMSKSGAELAQLTADAAVKNGEYTRAAYYKTQCADGTCYVEDTQATLTGASARPGYLNNHFEKDKLYLITRNASSAVKRNKKRADGSDVPLVSRHPDDFSEEAPDWYTMYGFTNLFQMDNPQVNTGKVIDTHTLLVDGELKDDGTGLQRLTLKDAEVVVGPANSDTVTIQDVVHLDGVPMPLSQMTPLHKMQELRATPVTGEITRGVPLLDQGLAGVLTAPGYYNSGFYSITVGNPQPAISVNASGTVTTRVAWFVVTGNYLNYMQHLNLWLKKGSGTNVSSGNTSGGYFYVSGPPYNADWLASVVPYPMSEAEWPCLDYDLNYPGGGVSYEPDARESATARAIEMPGAKKVQLHFASLDLGEGDQLHVYDGEGESPRELFTYSRADNSADGFWSPAFTPGDTSSGVIVLKLSGNGDASVGKGYSIDRVRSTDNEDGTHLLKARHKVAKEAFATVMSMTKFEDVNWGYYHYKTSSPMGVNTSAAYSWRVNPFGDSETGRAAVLQRLNKTGPSGSTPTTMALQELWLDGFYKNQDNLKADTCNTNVVIHMTDGYPVNDTDRCKFKGAGLAFPVTPAGASFTADAGCFADWDGDQLQNPYDDIVQWMYEHSWENGEPTDKDTRRVLVHNIAFGARMTLLKNASDQTPGSRYATASNKAQMIAAIASMAPSAGANMSFAAPSVSADSSNRLQSGSEMYVPSFVPRNNSFWMGNVKKYKWGDGSAARPDTSAIYGKGDAALSKAPDYQFKGGTDYWGTPASWPEQVPVDDKGEPLADDGAGEVMLRALGGSDGKGGYFGSGDYYARPIYTVRLDDDNEPVRDGNGDFEMVKFDRTNITPKMLGLADDDLEGRDKLVNYVHGYTYDADADGNPTAVRDWPLGAIIHSQPVTVDYYREDPDTGVIDVSKVDRRYVVAGSNDGMLHVFSDTDGSEVFAFIPADKLVQKRDPKLTLRYLPVPSSEGFDGVDGTITIVRGSATDDENQSDERKLAPTYLIFGERRGGGHYWCLDIAKKFPVQNGQVNWKARWDFSHPEIAQTWSDVATARVLIGIDAETGERQYRRVALFSGGYDAVEDNFPEPFNKKGGDITPLNENGTVNGTLWQATPDVDDKGVQRYGNDGKKLWKKTEQDPNANGVYDIYNRDGDDVGRGIWIVDLEDPESVWPKGSEGTDRQILPFSVTWGEVKDEKREGNEQKRNDMIYSFPATPSVLAGTDTFAVSGEGRKTVLAVLRALYVPDIYANMWKVRQELTPTRGDNGWTLEGDGWKVNQIFNTRSTVNSRTSVCRAGDDCELYDDKAMEADEAKGVRDFDRGQKAFFGPSVSWGGTDEFFEPSNFNYRDPDHGRFSFKGRDRIATLYYGTGDPEHPTYGITHNRIYSLYDDTAISADEEMPEAVDDGTADPVELTLPGACDGYELPVTDEGAVVVVKLTQDCVGTVTVPANVGKVTFDLNGHTITGADGAVGGADGRPAIALANPGTVVTLKGAGGVRGGKGADAQSPITATLTEKCGFTSPVTAQNAVVEITLTHDCDDSTLDVPANVNALILNMNGHKIEADDAQKDGENGGSPIRLANPNTTLVITGKGELESGDGKHGGNGGDLVAGAGENTVVYISPDVERDFGEGEDDGKDGSFCGLKADGTALCREYADTAYNSAASGQAGDGGPAISGADVGTSIFKTDGATATGGAGGTAGTGNGKDGGICGLDGDGKEICALKDPDPDPGPDANEQRWYTRVGSLYDESNLMNLTCGELDKETEITSCYLTGLDCGDEVDARMKAALEELLTDDAVSGEEEYKNQLEGVCTVVTDADGNRKEVCVPPEDDRKGWYMVLDRQGDPEYCRHVQWNVSRDPDVDDHKGEQIMARTTLLDGTLYYTSYQANAGDATTCRGGGNGRLYAQDAGSAGSVFRTAEYDKENYGDVVGISKFFGDIIGVPTGLSVRYMGKGMVQVLGAMGDMTVGASPNTKQGLDPIPLNPPLKLIYWRDSNSRKP